MNINDAIEQAQDLIKASIVETGREVEPEELGLDERASYGKLIVVGNAYGDGAIIAQSESDNRVLSYYGGFEYVDKEHITELGTYTIYSSMSGRVQEAMERLEETEEV